MTLHTQKSLGLGAVIALALVGCSRAPSARSEPSGMKIAPASPTPAESEEERVGGRLDRIRLPPGFRIEMYASGVENARSMTLSPSGTLFVGNRKRDKVYAIPNADGDARGDRVIVLAEGLDSPNGVAFHRGALYVAENSRILRFDDVEASLERAKEPVVVSDAFPKDRAHGWKFIGIGPDEKLYVPIGAPCNVCEREDPRYSTITRMNLDGSGFEIFAAGIRNTVGFDWHPVTKALWFTDNGRDRMGDDVPPDELNQAPEPGLFFGFPYCHGRDIVDPEFQKQRACSGSEPPELLLGPHVAALGMRFYTGTMFPAEFRNQIFIAEHGSWNRSRKIGYRVSLARFEGKGAMKYETFAEGWLDGETAWGRPVDVIVAPDGALLVSDDELGAIYRISYATPTGEK